MEHEQTKGQMSLLWWVFVIKTWVNTTQRGVLLSSLKLFIISILMFSIWPDLIIMASLNNILFPQKFASRGIFNVQVPIFCLMFDTICHILQMSKPLTHIPQRNHQKLNIFRRGPELILSVFRQMIDTPRKSLVRIWTR